VVGGQSIIRVETLSVSSLARQLEQVEEEILVGKCLELHQQKRNDLPKLYSMHAPGVECIAKGKSHKRTNLVVRW